MLSKKAKYALKALVLMAKQPAGSSMLIADIARQEAIPRKFLEIILLELKNQGILCSRRGKLGGYSLQKPAAEIALADIIRVSDGPMAPTPCTSKKFYQRCTECIDERTCEIRQVMFRVRDAICGVLENTSLQDAVEVLPSPVGSETETAGNGNWLDELTAS